ncbi:hypothetical protein PR003_g33364, partial [Phytophthora rubi]
MGFDGRFPFGRTTVHEDVVEVRLYELPHRPEELRNEPVERGGCVGQPLGHDQPFPQHPAGSAHRSEWDVRFATRPTTTKPVKMPVPTFDGKNSDSLGFWVREIEIALSAGQIYDARAQVAFALSNLGGRARAWAMARETATPGYFTSWSFMEQELRSTFLLANVAYRHRSSFLRCKQGKRSLQDYVMELHNLEAAMAGAPLSEDVKVTVFMDGVRTGP